MLSLLPAGGMAAGEWKLAALDECGIPSATFHRYRKEFNEAGRIIKSKVSGKWQPVNRA